MEFNIILEDNNKSGIINLKNFIEKASIDGVETVEINRDIHSDGEMGAGAILSSITAMLSAVKNPLTELVKCLQKYVDNFRTTLKVSDGKGGFIEISHGRSMSPEQLKEIVAALQQK